MAADRLILRECNLCTGPLLKWNRESRPSAVLGAVSGARCKGGGAASRPVCTDGFAHMSRNMFVWSAAQQDPITGLAAALKNDPHKEKVGLCQVATAGPHA